MQDTEIQELFAQLTAQFEDCAALAAEGQRAGLSQATAAALLREIVSVRPDRYPFQRQGSRSSTFVIL